MRFDLYTWVAIAGGGVLTPALVIDREKYADGDENYYVAFELDNGESTCSWVLSDDLMRLSDAPAR